MEDEATLEEDVSIHDKLMAKLQPSQEEVVEEEASVEPVEDSQDTLDAEETEEVEHVESEEDVSDEPEAITLDDIAHFTGIESDRFDVTEEGQLIYKAKVDGKEESVPLKDALDNYQIRAHLNKENTEVVELKKQLQSKLEETNTQTQQKLDEAEALIAAVYTDFMTEYESIDWNSLKQEDREEYLIKKQEFDERKARLADSYQQVLDKKPKPDPQALERDIIDARKQFVNTVPEWAGNDEVANREWSEMTQYSVKKGFGENDLLMTTDPKLLEVMRNSMLYEKIMQESPKITKQVRKAPKLVKPSNKPKPSNDEKELKKLQAKVKAGQPGAIAEMLLKTGKVK